MLLVLLIASVLVVLIYSLPKVVVSDEEGELSTETNTEDVHIHDEEGSTQNVEPEQLREFRSDFIENSDGDYNPEWAVKLAELYLDLGFVDSAIWVSDRLMEDGREFEARVVISRTYLNRMRSGHDEVEIREMADSAERNFQLVLAEKPDDLRSKNQLAEVFLTKGEVMRSVKLLKEIVETEPNNVEAQFQLGILSIQSGQLEKGIERFSKVIETDSANVKAYYWLAYCLANTGSAEEANSVILQAKELTNDPEVIAALESLSENI